MIRWFWLIALAVALMAATAIAFISLAKEPGTFSYDPTVGYMYEVRGANQEPVHFSKRVAQQAAESFIQKHWGIPEDAKLDMAGAFVGVVIDTGRSTIYGYDFEWQPDGTPRGLYQWGRMSASVQSRHGRPFVNSAIYLPFGWPQADRLHWAAESLLYADANTVTMWRPLNVSTRYGPLIPIRGNTRASVWFSALSAPPVARVVAPYPRCRLVFDTSAAPFSPVFFPKLVYGNARITARDGFPVRPPLESNVFLVRGAFGTAFADDSMNSELRQAWAATCVATYAPYRRQPDGGALQFAASVLENHGRPPFRTPLAFERGDCFLERDLSSAERTRFGGDTLQYGGGMVVIAKGDKPVSAWHVTDAPTQVMLSYAYNLACPLRGPQT